MKTNIKLNIGAALVLGASVSLLAQDRTVFFDVNDPGVSKSVPTWGLDTAWLSDVNVIRGVEFMGRQQVDVIRGSFTGDWPLVGGNLGPDALAELNERFRIVNTYTRPDTALYLNNDTGSIHSSFAGVGGVNPLAWAQLIDATRREFVARGRTVVAVAPFNEPDYGTDQGGITRFGDVCWQLRNTFRAGFDGIRLVGGNTLNNDVAATWYNPLNIWNYLEEGNTHQLAGSFDTYAAFYQSVQANGDVGTNDELHNVMEAIVGVEYGMDAGIWWGSAEYARGEFVKASDGMRLAYAEHRPNWTAAAVYRAPDGKVQAFVGESERQAQPTTYQFISKDRPVYFDGEGPQRTYTVTTTGAPAYWTAEHRNAEKVVNITWGEDVQPAINGRYYLVARHSGKVMEVAGASQDNGGNIIQNSFTGATNQQWDVVPLARTVGGDYSYHTLVAAHSGKAADITGFSLDNGGNVSQWPAVTGVNQQYVLEYAEDGWFRVRSKWSGKYVDVAGISTSDGANIHQWEATGGFNQQWRLIPVGSDIEFIAPVAPVGLAASANPASVSLSWGANSEADLSGYNVYRAVDPAGPFEMIARGVTTTAYTDESATRPANYYYKAKAVDRSLNRSAYSATAVGSASGVDALVAHYSFEDTLNDLTVNSNRATAVGSANFVAGPVGGRALALNGSNHLLLPATVANHDEFSFAAWVYWNGGADWQRIFDFGNGIDNNLFLTPRAGGAGLRFGFRQGGIEQQVDAPALAINRWVHVAVTLAAGNCRIYVDGALAGSLAATFRPSDFKPVMNYLGKSQWPDPLLNGSLDDVRIYNHALSVVEVADLVGPPAPTNLIATAGNTQVSLSWNAVSGATSYIVKRATASGGPYTSVASDVTSPSYVDTGLANGTTYYYVVSAVGAGGESIASEVLSATPALVPPPSPWTSLDVGAVGAAGSVDYEVPTFTVMGSGADIAGTLDEFHYAHQPSSGDCSITVRVASLTNTNTAAKAGIMIRESTAANSRYAGVFITPSGSVRFQRRSNTGGNTSTTSTSGTAAPRWLRLTRTGNIFRAFQSQNGTTWTQFGNNQTISIASGATIGLAVSSRVDGVLCTANIDNVTATP